MDLYFGLPCVTQQLWRLRLANDLRDAKAFSVAEASAAECGTLNNRRGVRRRNVRGGATLIYASDPAVADRIAEGLWIVATVE